MKHISSFRFTRLVILLSVLHFGGSALQAQTSQFTYQGRLTDGGSPASAAYDLQFRLFDALVSGNQVGFTVVREDVAVANGIFSVSLDFGAAAFPGADRWLEISVRPGASIGAFTTLSPIQPIHATPYAVRSLSAATAALADGLSVACVNCVTSAQISSIAGSQVTGEIPVAGLPAGSGNYIQNKTTQQATANFNISGNGTAGGTLSGNRVNATTQYNIGGIRLLSVEGANNLFVGYDAGAVVTSGYANAFFGMNAGRENSSGSGNSFIGAFAGALNTIGSENTFVGGSTGYNNIEGNSNSYFGYYAGQASSGSYNSFFGTRAGTNNTSGVSNAFFGDSAGAANTTANYNAFFGSLAGTANTTGAENAFFGRRAGELNTTGTANTFVGWGAGNTNTTGNSNTLLGHAADVGANNLTHATAIGANAVVTTSNTIVLGRSSGTDKVRVPGLGAATAMHLCIDTANQNELSLCSSSLRYKKNVTPLPAGLGLILRLRPVTFAWKETNERDLGLIAEEVAAVEPLLVTHNGAGEIQGVKYDQLNVVLINAIKEQQEQLKQQQEQIRQQQAEIAALKRLVCLAHPQAAACGAKEPQQ